MLVPVRWQGKLHADSPTSHGIHPGLDLEKTINDRDRLVGSFPHRSISRPAWPECELRSGNIESR